MPGCAHSGASGAPAAVDEASGGGPIAPGVLEDIIAALQRAVQALADALTGAGLITEAQPAPAAPAAPAEPTAPTIPADPTTTGPLAGFIVEGDDAEQAQLAASLAAIESTSAGAGLLQSIRDTGVHLDIVSDEEYELRTGSRVSESVGVFMSSVEMDAPPTILLRSSKIGEDPAQLTRILAHELTHALQFNAGERDATYQAGAGSTSLSADQLEVGTTLMQESGAELVASAILAQLQDPAQFAEAAKRNFGGAVQSMWDLVNIADYNPAGHQLPVVVSPSAVSLLKAVLGITG